MDLLTLCMTIPSLLTICIGRVASRFIAFIFSLTFSLFLPLIHVYLSLARTVVVMYLLNSRFKSKHYVFRIILHGSALNVLFAATLAVLVYKKGGIASNLCSSFTGPTDSIVEIRISTWLVTCLQLISLTFISVMCIALRKYLGNYLKANISGSKIKGKSITIQFLLVTISNLCCWLPSSMIYVTSLFVSKCFTSLIIWTTVVITPINSVINPIFLILLHQRRKEKASGGSFFKSFTVMSRIQDQPA